MYYIPLIIMIPFCIAELVGRDKNNTMFKIVFTLLLVAACFRYGQGTDYFGYMFNFCMGDAHSEIGYRMICELVKMLGGGFEHLIFGVTAFQMLCIYRAIRLFSPYKVTSLLILYPTVYLTYFCSALRQGMVVAFFLGFMVKWLLEDKKKRYIIGCIFLSTIHSASLVLLILIFIRYFNIRFMYVCLVGAIALGCFIYFTPVSVFSFINVGSFQYQIQNTSMSLIGLVERIVLFIIITWVYQTINKSCEHYEWISILYRVYFVGFIISIACFPWGLVSSRLPMMMKAVEVLLVPMMIKESKTYRQLLLTFFICYALLMTTKNLYSYITQGEYLGYHVITYPYLNVWDKDFANQVRKNDVYLQQMLRVGVVE